MAGTNTLQEFMVRIGFKVDEQSARNFNEVMRKVSTNTVEASKQFVVLAQSSAVAVTGLVAALSTIAKPLESLYYASQRTGASAKELEAFSYAAEQVGVSAEQARGAVEALATARRTSPGLNGILWGMGIDPKQTDDVKVILQLLGKLHSMPHYQGAQIAGMFGISEQVLQQLDSNGPAFLRALDLRQKMFAKSGIDPDKMDADAQAFLNQMRTMGAGVVDLSEIMASRLLPVAEKVTGWLQDTVGLFAKVDQSTSGLSTKAVALASLLGGVGVAKGGLGILGRLTGGAAAGEAAGGAGILGSLLSLPAIVAATLGYVASSQTAADGIRKMLGLPEKITADALKPSNVWHEAVKVATATVVPLVEAAKKSTMIGNALGNLQQMVARSEGFASRLYADHKGFSIGYGHLVKPGEDFSHGIDQKGALALLSKDLQAAVASVANLVKVHLNKNQTDALADFVFNLGAGNLAKSTLLKKLNAGDFAGAADQFQYWNHALVNGHMVVNQGLSDRRAADAALFRSQDKSVTLNQQTTIHAPSDSTAKDLARHQERTNSDLLRNMVGVYR